MFSNKKRIILKAPAKTAVLFFLSLSFLVLIYGMEAYAQQSMDPEKRYYFYYVDPTETLLERETFRPLDESTEGMLSEITAHINNEEGTSTHLVLPDDVAVLRYVLQDGSLQLDFSGTYRNMSRTREILVRDGIVKMFLQIPGVSQVSFTIEGEALTDAKGSIVGPMHQESFVEHAIKGIDDFRYETFTLYFVDKDGKKLVPERRRVYYKSSIPKARVALEQLVNGPPEIGRYPTIPGNTTLNSVLVSDKVCYVDFNSVFSEYAMENLKETIPIYSVVNTVIDATGAEKVEISIDGRTDLNFGEHTALYQFFHWNQEVIREEEGM